MEICGKKRARDCKAPIAPKAGLVAARARAQVGHLRGAGAAARRRELLARVLGARAAARAPRPVTAARLGDPRKIGSV